MNKYMVFPVLSDKKAAESFFSAAFTFYFKNWLLFCAVL